MTPRDIAKIVRVACPGAFSVPSAFVGEVIKALCYKLVEVQKPKQSVHTAPWDVGELAAALAELGLKQPKSWRSDAARFLNLPQLDETLMQAHVGFRAAVLAFLMVYSNPHEDGHGWWLTSITQDLHLVNPSCLELMASAAQSQPDVYQNLLSSISSMRAPLSRSINQHPNPFPAYWINRSGSFNDLIDTTMIDAEWIGQWLQDSWHDHCIYSRNVAVSKVERVEHAGRWRTYAECARAASEDRIQHGLGTVEQLSPETFYLQSSANHSARCGKICSTLDKLINERFLFHGTHQSLLEDVLSDGLDPRTSREGRYGYGTYFTDQACKAIQYTQDEFHNSGDTDLLAQPGKLLLCRVALGNIFYADAEQRSLKRPPRSYDSVVANIRLAPNPMPQIHREFVVYSMMQIYVEYIVSFVSFVPSN
eukprot:TRINITY_DN39383_c0_g1_i1.p1 TRINITY_DN39383_c0_g1~~TRINITY_DN39383_c0_g1_i1.p1  ORF type:complete len:466 (-),score=41.13 TRINITY_DN39383_c0_g1_i1:1067-2332(-)